MQQFIAYLPWNFITTTVKLYSNGFSSSAIEKILQSAKSKKLISKFYRALLIQNTEYTACVKSLWEADFNVSISRDEWDRVWQSSSGCLFTNKARELKFKVIHRLQITPVKRNKFNPLLSKYCNKCKINEGSYFHSIFDCPVLISGIKCVMKLMLFFRRSCGIPQPF